MSNLPIVAGNTAELQAQFAKNKVVETQGGGAQFLSFDSKRTGEWLFGVEREPCTGDEFGMDLSSLKHGYVQWHNKKANRLLVPVTSDLPTPQQPISYTDNKGREQVDEAMEARAFEGVFSDGTRFVFETNSFGGRKAVDAIFGQLFMRARTENPFMFPRLKLSSDSYEHKTFGVVFTPVFDVVAWYDEAGNQEGVNAVEDKSEDTDNADTAAPQRRRRGAV